MNNTSIDLVGLELTESNMSKLAGIITKAVDDGFQDSIELDRRLKFIEETIKIAREKLNKSAIIQAYNHSDIASVRNGYAILDYDTDSAYKSIKDRLSERKSHLDLAFKSKDEIVINGEIIPKIVVKNYTKDSVIYKFPK